MVDEANGWEADPTKGDSGHGGVRQIRNVRSATIPEVDSETGLVLGTHEETIPEETGGIEDVEYGITNGELIVTATLKVRRKNAPDAVVEWLSGSDEILTKTTRFSRVYQVFLRRPKSNAPVLVADIAGLLITQRTLCVQIQFGDCIKKIPIRDRFDFSDILVEVPFDLDDLFGIPLGINVDKATGSIHPKGPRFDFAFKKGIIRKIQQAMVTAGSSPFRYNPGEVGYLQSRHFQKRLLKVLPDKILDRPLQNLDFVDQQIKDSTDISLREFLSITDSKAAVKAGISLREIRGLKTMLFRSRESQS